MQFTLEVVPLPVSDIDRAKEFYTQRVGWPLDHDVAPAPGVRYVQITPPGSGCSIVLGASTGMTPGTLKGVQLVVADIVAARAELAGRGVDISEVQAVNGDAAALEQGGKALDFVGFAFFDDPDGNTWAIQQISARGEK
ncbi:VOC family protein [Kineosporia succinea]|uniref:Enzyme related to lactoylglutathione lyase n=1 Tax=Kineosporia succinea TaxID=84632 RepID=A0ABT9PCW3_9ACTN|nr:VOC family protein [Kineosporia succinea]MDP9830010.1 putative enzyme related to lactoylglutathione lyase [Kineosporia succinea]